MIVVDASILAPALADDNSDGEAARAGLRGQALAAPELIDLEVSTGRFALGDRPLTDRRY